MALIRPPFSLPRNDNSEEADVYSRGLPTREQQYRQR